MELKKDSKLGKGFLQSSEGKGNGGQQTEIYENFECPVCGCKEYNLKYKEPARFGGKNSVDSCSCKGCSVLFGDPEKFSKAKITRSNEGGENGARDGKTS